MATNTLTNLIPDMWKAMDVVSRELVGFIPAVNSSTGVEGAALDQIVNVPVVGAETAADNTPAVTAPDTGTFNPDNVEVKITKSKHVPVRWHGEEQLAVGETGIYQNVQQARFAQAYRTLTNMVETDLAAQHLYASRAFGTAGTIPFTTVNDLTDASFALKILDDNGAPDDRHIVLGTTATAQLRGKQPGLFNVDASGDGGAMLRAGTVGSMFGADMHTSGQVATHTTGAALVACVTTAAGYAVGSTTINIDAASTSGVIDSGDTVSFAGDSEKYIVVTGLADVGPGGAIVIAEPGLLQAIPTATTAITKSASSVRNMVFSRSAIALAARPPAVPDGGDMAIAQEFVTDPITGITFRVAMYKQFHQNVIHVALAWGTKMVAPRHCGILLG